MRWRPPSTAVGGGLPLVQETLDNLPVLFQIGPTGGEFHDHTTNALAYTGSDLDKAGPPSTRLTFSQGIVLTAAVVPSLTLPSAQGFGRDGFFRYRGRRWIGRNVPQVNQQIERGRMQVQSKKIGEVAVIAQSVRLQSALEFFVAVLAFASVGIGIICGAGQNERSGTVGDHGPPIRALRVGLTLYDHPTLVRP